MIPRNVSIKNVRKSQSYHAAENDSCCTDEPHYLRYTITVSQVSFLLLQSINWLGTNYMPSILQVNIYVFMKEGRNFISNFERNIRH